MILSAVIVSSSSIPRAYLVLLVSLLATNCFSPNRVEGLNCSAEGLCPSGLNCYPDMVCRSEQVVDSGLTSTTLSALRFSFTTPILPDFSPSHFNYEAALSPLQSTVRVTASATNPGATIEISGTQLGSGTTSEPIPLKFGQNEVTITVRSGSDSQDYVLTVERGMATVEQEAYMKAFNTSPADHFGQALALSEDTLVVGAPGEGSDSRGIDGELDNNGAASSGAVYVFRHTASGWAQEAYIKASNSDPGDTFGKSIALSGNLLIVGAPREKSGATGINGIQSDNKTSNAGAVYVFRRSGSSWTQEAYIKADNTDEDDLFGSSVSTDGDRIAVGASQEDSLVANSGGVYVFRHASNIWVQEAHLKASNLSGYTFFGASVSLSGDLLVVGAIGESSNSTGVNGDQDNTSAIASGAAYVYRYSADSWTQEAYLKASNTAAADRFGQIVAVSGDTIAASAGREGSGATGVNGDQKNNDQQKSGAAYVFRHNGSNWSQEAYIKASNTDENDNFGVGLALHDDMLIVAADLEDSPSSGVDGVEDNTGDGNGAAYLFRRSDKEWSQTSYIKASNTGNQDNFGFSIAVSENAAVVGAVLEDSNADGVNDVENNNGASNSGAVYLFR